MDDASPSRADPRPPAGRRPLPIPARWRNGFEIGPLWLPLTILGAVFLVGTFIPPHGFDLIAYTSVDWRDPYALPIDALNAQGRFFYAPPIALLFAPLGALPSTVATFTWLGLQLLALWYIGRRWFLALVILPPVWLDLVYGNINVLLAAAVVASFRTPGTWAFPLLTKVTPGVGVLWFPVRREWRACLLVAATLATAVAISIVVQGAQVWTDWIDALRASQSLPTPSDALAIPLIPRVVVAAVLVAWGAWTDRRWTVPLAVTLAMPVLWVIALAPLVALASPVVWRRSDPSPDRSPVPEPAGA